MPNRRSCSETAAGTVKQACLTISQARRDPSNRTANQVNARLTVSALSWPCRDTVLEALLGWRVTMQLSLDSLSKTTSLGIRNPTSDSCTS